MKTYHKIIIALVLLTLATVLILNINRATQTQISTTFYPLYEFTKQIAGNKATVANITPAGAEPHDFEPSPQQLANAQSSKVFVYNGVNFEPWLDSFLQDYKGIGVNSSKDTNLISDDGHNDPHFWLDPALAKQMVDNILTGLTQFDPQNSNYYRANADAYKAELDRLDQEFAHGLAVCKTRTVISSHEAFNYLARRYDLNLVPIAGISPDEEPNPAKLAEISSLVKDQGVQYIFFETLVSPRLADTIASETGAKTAVLDPIEGLTDEDQANGKNYLSVQRQNLANLRTALTCQ